MVSKVRGSRYSSGRGKQRETLPIAGFAIKENKFDGIYVGRQKGNDLVYAGKVDHGFDKTSAKLFARAPHPTDPQNAALCEADRA